MAFKQQKTLLVLSATGVLLSTLTLPVSAAPSKHDIFAAQNALYGAGFDIGKADGNMGPALQAAVKKFQESQSGLKATGDLDTATLAALGVSEGSDEMSTAAPVAAAPTAAAAPKPVAEKAAQPAAQPKPAEKPKKKEHHWWEF